MPKSGKHIVNGIDSFFKVRPSKANVREGESVSFLEDGVLIKQEKRNGIVYETKFAEQGKKEEVITTTGGSSGGVFFGGGDLTSVTAGTGLSGGGDSGSISLSVSAAQTSITSILATDVKIGEDNQTKIDFETADTINFYAGNEKQLILTDGALTPGADNILDLGSSGVEFKDAFFDGTVTSDAFAGPLTGDVTGNVSGTAATVTTAAQTNITSLGTLTALTVDDVAINGKVITMTGSSSDTAVFTAGTNGTLSIVTTDAAAAAANIQITADGTVDIDSAGALTLDSGAAINLEPASGSAILLDGTISVDAGVVTGATSVTSTAFVGDITGDVTGNADTATLATLASTVTITDNESTNENNAIIFTAGGDLDGGNLGLESDGDLYYNPSTGTLVATNISVSGTLTTVDSVTMNANNAVVFEGSAADAHETTLSSVNATADSTINLPNMSAGTYYLPVLAVASTTAISSTPAEINLLDGSSANTVVNSKAVIYGSSGELAGTLSTAAQTNVTSLGTLTALTVDNVSINGTTIGHTSDTDLITLADGNVTIAGELDLTTLDVSGNADIDGTLEADAYTVDGTALATYIRDTVGTNMLSSNTETGIAVTYDTSNDNIDFVIDSAQTAIASIYNSSLKLGTAAEGRYVDFSQSGEVRVALDNTLYLKFINNGSGADEVVFNPSTGNIDFKVESDDGTDLILADASANTVTIAGLTLSGTTTAATVRATKLQLSGTGDVLIEHHHSGTDDTDTAITVKDGGGVEFANGITVNSGASTMGALSLGDNNLTNVGQIGCDMVYGDGDTDTQMIFSGSDVITFKIANTTQFTFNDGSILPTTDDDIDLGSASYQFKDGYFDGTVYADVIDLNGTTLVSSPITALNNATANELVTVGSTTTELDAEANLTFDGSTLTINNSTSGVSALDFEDASDLAIFVPAAQTSNYFQPLIGVGENATTFTAAISSYDAGSSAAQGLAFHTGNTNAITEAMRIDSSQNVGIGETSPASDLVVRTDTSGGRGGEITILNYATNAVGNEAALNFGLEASTYNADNGNAQIKARVNASNAATDMIFSTWNGSAFGERARISSAGNVGIGTVSPASWLDVSKDNSNSGNQFMVADTEGATAAVRTYTTSSPAALVLNHYYAVAGSGNEYMRYADLVANVGSGAGTTMRFITKNAANTYFTTTIDNTGKLTVPGQLTIGGALTGVTGFYGASNTFTGYNNTYNFKNASSGDMMSLTSTGLGIGTASPGTNLEVTSTGNTTTRISTDGDSGDVPTLQLYRNGSAYSQIHYEADGGSNAGLHITDFRDDANSHIVFNTRGDNERMRIEGDGSVGIGTTSPGEKLTIKAGGTTAQEVIKIRDSGNTEKFVIGLQATTGNPTISTNDGDLYVDATHDINLDAAGGQIFFTQAGTAVGQIDMAGTDLEIKSLVSNATFTLRGNDGGSEIDMLAFDVAGGGNATFSGNIEMANSAELKLGGNDGLRMQGGGANTFMDNYSGDLFLRGQNDNSSIHFMLDDGSGGLDNYITLDGTNEVVDIFRDIYLTATKKLYLDTGGDTYIYEQSSNDLQFWVGNECQLQIDESSNLTAFNVQAYDQDFQISGDNTTSLFYVDASADKVGIGTNSPDSYNNDGDDFVIYGTGNTGMSIVSGTSSNSSVMFADGTGGTAGYRGAIKYNHGSDYMHFNTAATERMRIDSSGNVGIGTNSPDTELEVVDISSDCAITSTVYSATNGHAPQLALRKSEGTTDGTPATTASGEDLGIIYFYGVNGAGTPAFDQAAKILVQGDAAPDSDAVPGRMTFWTSNASSMVEAVRIDDAQDLHCDQDVIAFSTVPSDIRLKKNFEKIENGLDVVNKLEGHTFNWKKDDKRLSAGFKAQEVEKILPHLVDEKKLPLRADDDKDYKVLRYEEIIPYLVEAIKEQQIEIDCLKANLDQLKYNRR